MQPLANPQGSGTTPEELALERRIRTLFKCTPEEAGVIVAGAVRDSAHHDPPYADWGKRHELRKILLEYRARAQSPLPHPLRSPFSSRPNSPTGEDDEDDQTDDEDADDDGLVEVCPMCGTTHLDTQMIQTRGGDEGATKFTKCLNPNCAAHIISPKLVHMQ
jgi:DNA-directed RNA polymerase subunit M/transcription elongation factor TFIIS